ncbi:MAG: transglycosylase domain-containing protein [Defluviitaleaceae bacterium]|nr:transglycosylase domain-containing protein [Defluviitaleaceae bacterium]
MNYSRFGNKKRGQNPHATRVRNKAGLLILRITISLVLVVGFAVAGLGIGVYRGIVNNSPSIDFTALGTGNLALTSFIISDKTNEELVQLHAGVNRRFVSISDVPQHLVYAFVAIEDERFFEHNGIDPQGIARAVYFNFTDPNRQTEGASTITQQLVKNMLGVQDNTFVTKMQEQHIAVNFENHLTEEFRNLGYEEPRLEAKNFIIQSYLNIASLGRGNRGVQAASWFYYGVSVSELSIVQSATIAAITQHPSRFPPDIRPQNNWGRTKLVLRNMHRLGFISDEEYEEALQEREVLDPETGEPQFDEDGEPVMLGIVYDTIFRMDGGGERQIESEFDCFTDALITQVREDLQREHNLTPDQADRRIFETGLRIYSTQDLDKQAIVDRAYLDDSLWPGPGAYIEVTYLLSVYNSITQQTRHYTRQRDVASMDAVAAFEEEMKATLLTEADEIRAERTFSVPQPQSAFVLIDHHTGHVVAMRGVRGEKQANRAFNRATQATRSPGSQMKPLAPFAALIDVGAVQPATVIDDIPFRLVRPGSADWTPTNHWSGYRGLSTVRNAIYASGNVVSARAAADPSITQNGVPMMMSYLEEMGISTLAPNDGAAIVLGGMTNGTRLIELAGAYATIANMGEYNRPVLYTRVEDHEGRILLDNRHEPQRVLRATTAFLLANCMMDTISRGTGGSANWTSASGLRGQIQIAGKTGTSQSNRDLGFSGFTPYYTASIWMGNDNEKPMHTRAREFHQPVWRAIMSEIHANLPARSFERPSGITSANACLDSGHLPTELCSQDPRGNRVVGEVFATIHVPTQYCEVHQKFTYCNESRMVAGPYCPDETVETRVGIVRAVPIDDISAAVGDRHLEFPLMVRQGVACTVHMSGFVGPSQNNGGFWDGLHDNPEYIIDMITGMLTPNPNYVPPLNLDNPDPAFDVFSPDNTPTPTATPWQGLGSAQEPVSTPPPFVNTVPIPGLD